MLGPVVKYPVEFRLIGDDSDVLREKAELMMADLRATPGSNRVWTNWGNSGYQVEVKIDSEAANLAGVTHKAVAETLTALLSGGYLTTYREGDHQVRVALRLRREKRKGLDDLSGIYVNGLFGKVPQFNGNTVLVVNQRWITGYRDTGLFKLMLFRQFTKTPLLNVFTLKTLLCLLL